MNKILKDKDITYIVDEEVIDDTLCPKCMEKIDSETEFCKCGFFVKAAKNASAFSFVFFIFVLSIVIALFMTKTEILPSISNKMATKITKRKMISFASPVIMVEDSLKHSGHIKKIHDLYQKPKHPNVLVIVIKPDYWSSMKSREKKIILSTVKKLWASSYRGKDPEVCFANPDR